MAAFLETIFDILYLVLVITMGITMIYNGREHREYRLYGIMATVLGCGDAFHLLPRIYALWTTGMQANAPLLGFGQFITSITMTAFYVILYYIWRNRYQISKQNRLTAVVFLLVALRIGLCFAPQNNWLSADAPLSWGIYRNIPFALLGIIIIVLFYQQARKRNDQVFRFMWLAITLSFGFYIPVVLFAGIVPAIGALMIPKTCAYVWIVWMGYREMKNDKRLSK